MKKITFVFLLFCTFLNAQVNNYNVGDVVDDFTVTDIHGQEHNLYSIIAEGKYVWLDFFFVTCVPCQNSAPTFNEFFDKYGCNEGDVYCLSINLGNDTDAQVQDYEDTYGGPFNHSPAASGEGGSGPVTTNFGVGAFPTFCLIGPENKLLEKDIWPLSGVETFENTFPQGFDPPLMQCSLGVEDQSKNFDVVLYPTITGGDVHIDLPRSMESSVEIFSLLGQQVYEGNFSEKDIHINLQVASGTYLVKVASENKSAVKRMVIK